MNYKWELKHLVLIAEQVRKRWDSNPNSVSPLARTERDGSESYDYNRIIIKDIDLFILVDSPLNIGDYVHIVLKDNRGSIRKPSIFRYKDRKLFDKVMKDLLHVKHQMQYGAPDKGDKLICEAFPEVFEKYICTE